ncbi:MAG: hypothetical protein R3F36_16615 [Candidatus Competibacteraceae bacterium]
MLLHSDAGNAAISRTPMASTPSATSRGNGGYDRFQANQTMGRTYRQINIANLPRRGINAMIVFYGLNVTLRPAFASGNPSPNCRICCIVTQLGRSSNHDWGWRLPL